MKKLTLTIFGLILANSSFLAANATTNVKNEGLVTTTIKTDEKDGLVTKTQEKKEDTIGKIISVTLNTNKEDYELEIAFKIIAKCLEKHIFNGKNLIRNVSVNSNENSIEKTVSFELVTEKNQEQQLNDYLEKMFGKEIFNQKEIKDILKNAIEKCYDGKYLEEFIYEYEKKINEKIKNIRNEKKLEDLNIFNFFNIGSFFGESKEDKELKEKLEEFKKEKLEKTKRNLQNLNSIINKDYLKQFVDLITSVKDGGKFEKQGASYFSSTIKK